MGLRFLFDYVSPYSYLCWTQVRALAIPVEPVPIVFGAVLDANGTKGPAEVPAKRRYIIRDLARLAHRFGVPFELPPAHPFNSLLALRTSVLPMTGEQRRALVDALFAAVWGGGPGVTEAATVSAIAEAVGVRAEIDDAAKLRLRQNTDEAIGAGVFGVPTMFVGGQIFFGCDSLPHLHDFLAHGDVVAPDLVDRWEHLPTGAVRRGR